MQQAVVCIASDVKDARRLVDSLKSVGFTPDDISLLMPDQFGAQELGYEKHSKAPEGFATGVLSGAVLGGVLGYLAGIGLLWFPDLGQFIAVGPILSSLSGIAVGGTIGGLSGGLMGLGVPEYEVKKYLRKIRFGSTLIAVHVDTEKEARTAEQALRSSGISNLHRTGETLARSPRWPDTS